MNGSVLETIGSPLVQVKSPPGATVAAKIESKNPGGSAKDRPALAMIEQAERDGEIEPGDHLVEPTSGNTGIGLSLVAAAKGYDITIVMPASKSEERRNIMTAYGADLELVEGEMEDARSVADRLEAEEGMYQLRQFENPANPEAHYRTTAVEIIDQIGDREPDAFVAGVGTGGTITGTARRLLEEYPDMEVVAVEPEENAVLSTGESGADDFQGMGPGFVSDILDTDLLDSVETVGVEAAEEECRRLAREEGILVGQSSGGTNLVARRVAERLADEDATCPPSPTESSPPPGIIMDGDDPTDPAGEEFRDCPLVLTLFWDSGERYMSTGMFDG